MKRPDLPVDVTIGIFTGPIQPQVRNEVTKWFFPAQPPLQTFETKNKQKIAWN